jgi:hypothetical protein
MLTQAPQRAARSKIWRSRGAPCYSVAARTDKERSDVFRFSPLIIVDFSSRRLLITVFSMPLFADAISCHYRQAFHYS